MTALGRHVIAGKLAERLSGGGGQRFAGSRENA